MNSILADSETCQSCGKCCKQFWWIERNEDMANRFVDMLGLKIKKERCLVGGTYANIMTLDYPCQFYDDREGKHDCEIHETKSHMCKLFPDNIPVDCYEALKDRCPIIAKTLKSLVK